MAQGSCCVSSDPFSLVEGESGHETTLNSRVLEFYDQTAICVAAHAAYLYTCINLVQEEKEMLL